ncbi:MAG: glycosyltransferase family 2 protein [Actinomycetota bacterium]|nr:glycosyltransferase family 2 protein [Actinomycetota bacterium]
MVLVAYALASAAITPLLPWLTAGYAGALAALTGHPSGDVLVSGASLSFRPYVALLLVLLAVCAPGSGPARLRLLVFSAGLYAVAAAVLDALLLAAPSWAPSPLGPAGGVLAVLTGVVVVVVSIFTHRRLPGGLRVATRRPTSRTTAAVLPLCLLGAALLTAAWSAVEARLFGEVRVPFNGWLHEEPVLFVFSTVCLLWGLSALEQRAKPAHGPGLSVAFLVPAHNEAHAIAACIAALDTAAARHPGRCTAYVVDNASSDGTAGVARAALEGCLHVVGRVLDCPTPGKAKALNFGLAHISDDVVVRIDADTLVEPDVLDEVVPWFWDRSVGGVGGFPLPKENGPRWLRALRLAEVYSSIAFFRVAQSAIDGTTVMPGAIAAYRRRLVAELGGFGQGFNGEDSDITMRIGRLGYRVVTDARVRARTECPATLAQLREQRQRWNRGRFHMAGRNLSSVGMCQGVRALGMLPASLLNAGRRCLMVPLLACAAAVEATDPSVLSLREVFAVARLVVGFQVVMAVVLLAVHGDYRALPYAPLTVLYRLVLAYIAFETVLTLALRDAPRALAPRSPEVPRLIPGGLA